MLLGHILLWIPLFNQYLWWWQWLTLFVIASIPGCSSCQTRPGWNQSICCLPYIWRSSREYFLTYSIFLFRVETLTGYLSNVLDPRQIFRDLHVQELKLSALATTNLVIKTGLWILCCLLPNSEMKNTDVPWSPPFVDHGMQLVQCQMNLCMDCDVDCDHDGGEVSWEVDCTLLSGVTGAESRSWMGSVCLSITKCSPWGRHHCLSLSSITPFGPSNE